MWGLSTLVVFVIMTLLILHLYNTAYATRVYFFHSESCKYCIDLEPAWDMFINSSPSSVRPMKIDKNANTKMAENFGVSSVPHIVKVQGDNRYVYDGDRSAEDLLRWAKRDE